jgi:uncharacterized membrane protein
MELADCGLVFLMGVTIRHFFNTMHARGGYRWWTWGATAAIFVAIIYLSLLPLMRDDGPVEQAALGPRAERFAAHAAFPDVASVVISATAATATRRKSPIPVSPRRRGA